MATKDLPGVPAAKVPAAAVEHAKKRIAALDRSLASLRTEVSECEGFPEVFADRLRYARARIAKLGAERDEFVKFLENV